MCDPCSISGGVLKILEDKTLTTQQEICRIRLADALADGIWARSASVAVSFILATRSCSTFRHVGSPLTSIVSYVIRSIRVLVTSLLLPTTSRQHVRCVGEQRRRELSKDAKLLYISFSFPLSSAFLGVKIVPGSSFVFLWMVVRISRTYTGISFETPATQRMFYFK